MFIVDLFWVMENALLVADLIQQGRIENTFTTLVMVARRPLSCVVPVRQRNTAKSSPYKYHGGHMRNVSEDSAVARVIKMLEDYSNPSIKFEAPKTEFLNVKEMTGNGYEHLVDKDGNVLCVFHNGHMLSMGLPTGNTNVTRSIA